LELCDVEKEDIGIVLGPQINEEVPAIEITYSVRVLETGREGRYEIDGSYTLGGVDASTVLNEVYPEVVRQFEEAFEESELYYYQE
jgi:hypothetical protein